jgi:hypothetical protein
MSAAVAKAGGSDRDGMRGRPQSRHIAGDIKAYTNQMAGIIREVMNGSLLDKRS